MGSSNIESKNAKWYVVHTYSGYENKVKTNLEKIIENRRFENEIFEIRVPTEDVVEAKGNETKVVTRKIFPGYVLIKMIMSDETWYVIRNTTGVTGFVGSGSKPVPLTEEEVEALGIDIRKISVDYAVGDNVRITGGAFANQTGVVKEIDIQSKTVQVTIVMFGRNSTVEVDIADVETI